MADFPTFVDWLHAQDVTLEPWQWEMARHLDDNDNKERQRKTGFFVARNGKTRLHELWWRYHGERAKAVG